MQSLFSFVINYLDFQLIFYFANNEKINEEKKNKWWLILALAPKKYLCQKIHLCSAVEYNWIIIEK